MPTTDRTSQMKLAALRTGLRFSTLTIPTQTMHFI